MAQEAALFYTDAQGITGGNIVEARAGSSSVLELHHELETMVEGQSGMATGRRRHGPVRVLKPLDQATPLLLKALCNNTALPKLEIKWYRPNPQSGVTEHFYTIALMNASVRKVEAWLPNTQDSDEQKYPPREWIHFGYQEIVWTWVDGGIEHSDNWRASEV